MWPQKQLWNRQQTVLANKAAAKAALKRITGANDHDYEQGKWEINTQ